MDKKCIFNSKKICDECNECNVCDLNKNKKCNNCGKCLELEGYDIKAIKVDEIFEKNEELKEYYDVEAELAEKSTANFEDLAEQDEVWEYIDDIKEIKDLLEEDKKLSKAHEKFPGFIVLNEKDEKKDEVNKDDE